MSDEKVLIGVIGGSGLYHLDNLTLEKYVNPETPWGLPSSPIAICSLPPSPTKIAFLARHGAHHTHHPSTVPSRANISALKSLGVRVILAFSAVGSLREEISPGSFVLPTQIIDRTKGIRPCSFFEDTEVVAHASFGDPMSLGLVRWLEGRVGEVLEGVNTNREEKKKKEAAPVGEGGEGGEGEVKLFKDKCIVCMEGPQFSTRAESLMYRQWGADLINMSVLPEAKLAREAELSYALIATATDYDAWRPQSATVTAAEVFKTLKANAEISRKVIAAILEDLQKAITVEGNEVGEAEEKEKEKKKLLLEEVGTMKYSIMPRAGELRGEDKRKLGYVLPEYFS